MDPIAVPREHDARMSPHFAALDTGVPVARVFANDLARGAS